MQPAASPQTVQRAAGMGRGGDTRMAHMTLGERVLPREVAAMRPDLVAHIESAIRQYGGDPAKYKVGAGRINPATGAEEFATEEEIKAAYRNTLGREADAEGLAYWSNNAEAFSNGAFAQGAQAELAARSAPAPAPAPAPTVSANSTQWFEGLNDKYQSILGRDMDDDGRSYWLGKDANTLATDDELERNFLEGAAMELAGRNKKPPTTPWIAGSGYTDTPAVMNVAPTMRTVDAAKETTQGQLDSILAKNGLLMQRATGLAMSAANDRGMQNSSMAAGAGTAAMIDAATPIAKADADAYAQASMDNQKYDNAASVFNSQAYNDAQMAGFNASQEILKLNLKIAADKDLTGMTGQQKLDQIGEQGRIERELQLLKNTTSLELANIEAQYKTTMQGSESARSLYTEISKNITNIMTNKDIPAEEKSRLVAQQSELLRSGLAIAGAGANTDFLRILDFTGGTGSTAPGGTINTGPTPAPTAAPVINQGGGAGWIEPAAG